MDWSWFRIEVSSFEQSQSKEKGKRVLATVGQVLMDAFSGSVCWMAACREAQVDETGTREARRLFIYNLLNVYPYRTYAKQKESMLRVTCRNTNGDQSLKTASFQLLELLVDGLLFLNEFVYFYSFFSWRRAMKASDLLFLHVHYIRSSCV